MKIKFFRRNMVSFQYSGDLREKEDEFKDQLLTGTVIRDGSTSFESHITYNILNGHCIMSINW